MEIRVLRYFLEIARENNMSRAAETLHVSQPTLSKQRRRLWIKGQKSSIGFTTDMPKIQDYHEADTDSLNI